MNSSKIVIYEPDQTSQPGHHFFREIIKEILDNRWLTYQLFYRDFSTMYKQSLMGFLWVFILPIMNVATFFVLSRSGVFNIGEINVPYPLFGILGMAFWQIFAGGVVTASMALNSAGEMITRINFSKKSLVIAALGRTLVSFAVQMVLVLILCLVYQISPKPGALLLPLVVLPILWLTLGIGFLLAPLSAIIKDINNMLYILLMLLMYLTPVLYHPPHNGLLETLTKYNLMAYFVTAGRDLFLQGTISEWPQFLGAAVISLLILAVALRIFHVTETRITERI